jgi:hypothetical protein
MKSKGSIDLLFLPILNDALFFSAWGPDNQGVNRLFGRDLMMRCGVGWNEGRHTRCQFLHFPLTGLF